MADRPRETPRAVEFAVRRGRREDLPAVAELAGRVLPEAGDAASLASFLDGAAGRLWVAGDQAGVAGFLLANRVADEAEILWMGVAAEARRTGLGRALIEAASSEPPAPAVLVLEVRAGNTTGRSFYAALGFREEGERRGYYGGGEDAIRMARRV
ncbi:MAG: GNAT family N-acetyltransferase [Deltaproteobacteria bacterium]|nr:GNAT family N-acetyltransferase [Deltaproteobacteria bacterium]